MRLFIAIEIPEEVKNHLISLQEKLKEIPKDQAKLTFTKDFHLTLKFLGEVDKPEPIIEELKNISFEPFDITLQDTGVFPDENYIRVVWVGLKDGDKVKELQQKVEANLKNFPKDKRFHPHLTLCRVKFAKDKELFIKIVKELKVDALSFNVDHFSLIKSTLTPEGPVYEELARFPIK